MSVEADKNILGRHHVLRDILASSFSIAPIVPSACLGSALGPPSTETFFPYFQVVNMYSIYLVIIRVYLLGMHYSSLASPARPIQFFGKVKLVWIAQSICKYGAELLESESR